GSLGMSPKEIDSERTLAAYGLDSRIAVSMSSALEIEFGTAVPPTVVYEYPTVARLCDYIIESSDLSGWAPDNRQTKEEVRAESAARVDHRLAVIGIGCRFPAADGPDAFWRLVRSGVDAIGPMPATRGQQLPNPHEQSAVWGGFLDQVDRFDPEFFLISAREAIQMDPQHRILLEVAYEAIEDAGISTGQLAGSRCGVYIGIATHDYDKLGV